MKQNWSSEDFLEVVCVSHAAEDFWDPTLQGTDLTNAAERQLVALPQSVADPPELDDSARTTWTYDDFDGTQPRFTKINDPWEEFVTSAVPAEADTNSDFWDPSRLLPEPS